MITVQGNCPNKETSPCHWRSPNNKKITMAVEAQELAQLNFAVCPTNPNMMQRKLEGQEGVEHNQVAEARAANVQAVNVQAAMCRGPGSSEPPPSC